MKKPAIWKYLWLRSFRQNVCRQSLSIPARYEILLVLKVPWPRLTLLMPEGLLSSLCIKPEIGTLPDKQAREMTNLLTCRCQFVEMLVAERNRLSRADEDTSININDHNKWLKEALTLSLNFSHRQIRRSDWLAQLSSRPPRYCLMSHPDGEEHS